MFKKVLSLLTLGAFVWCTLTLDLVRAQEAQSEFKPPTFEEIYQNYSFIDTATLAEKVTYPQKDIERERKSLEQKEKAEKLALWQEYNAAKKTLQEKQKALKEISNRLSAIVRSYEREEIVIVEGKPRKEKHTDQAALDQDLEYQHQQEARKKIVCEIKEWQLKSDKTIYEARKKITDIFYDVLGTQLDLLEHWPEDLAKIKQILADNTAGERLFANPENIGLRDLGVGDQTDDLKILQNPQLQDLLKELRQNEYENPKVKKYVIGLVQTIAANSDLKIPLEDKNILILKDEDVNAFAIIGGILAINVGLLKMAENEAQLAGVIAHETGHFTARHAHRLMKKASMAGMIFQVAQIVALITTGGALTYLTYYLLQLGFGGLGLLLNLKLLGVSREFEVEADILGMQYVWKTGYDPMSFMSFFEKMGRDKGYIRHTSFFRTHPAFSQRIVNSYREQHFLPTKEDYVVNTTAFLEMKARLCVDEEREKAKEQEEKKRVYRPTLKRKQDKEEERIERECGMKKPEDNRPSPCDNPILDEYKARVREELAQEKEKQSKNGPELKRPEAETPPQNPPPKS